MMSKTIKWNRKARKSKRKKRKKKKVSLQIESPASTPDHPNKLQIPIEMKEVGPVHSAFLKTLL